MNTAAAILPGCGTTPAGDLPARRGLPFLGGAMDPKSLPVTWAHCRLGTPTSHHPDAASIQRATLRHSPRVGAASTLPVPGCSTSLWNFPAALVVAGLCSLGGAA